MASRLTQGRPIIQDENFNIRQKDLVTDGATRSSKLASKRGGTGFGSRKALNDITNKSSIRHEVSSKKPSLPKEEFNIAEEQFLHDHKKCINEPRLKGTDQHSFWDIVLPGHDDVSHKEQPKSKQAKTDHDIPRCYLEESMSEFSAELSVSTQWVSPKSSPTLSDSSPSPSSSFAWEAKPIEFKLKDKK